jgi:hypothetical protein
MGPKFVSVAKAKANVFDKNGIIVGRKFTKNAANIRQDRGPQKPGGHLKD